jgi:hypothetical protein
MEKSYLPWQTPGLKLKHKRQPLVERSSQEGCQESPLPPGSIHGNDQSWIWRTRSLDDGRRGSRAACTSSQEEDQEEINNNTNLHIHHMQTALIKDRDVEELDLRRPQKPLHSSFDDAALLDDNVNNDHDDNFQSIFRVTKRRASASASTTLGSASKQSISSGNELTPHSSGRKHLRQQAKARTGNNLFGNDNEGTTEEEEDELVCPGTVRKLARHNSNESIKSKGTPVRPRGTPTFLWRTGGTHANMRPPCSSNVNAASNTNNNNNGASVWKPPVTKFPLFPLTPTAPNSTATASTHPPTTQERPFETTARTNTTIDTTIAVALDPDSPSVTPFRFTSFPASLPRVHPPLRETYGLSVPDSVRKRMFPPSTTTAHHHHPCAASAPTPFHHSNNLNNSREEDGTQNTSLSSLSTHGEDDPRMPSVHTRLFLEEESYAYSDDEDDDQVGQAEEEEDGTHNGHDKPGVAATRTRLNFNLLLNPKIVSLQKEQSPFKALGGNAAEKGECCRPGHAIAGVAMSSAIVVSRRVFLVPSG